MAFDFLSELTTKGKGFGLQHSPGSNPLLHNFDLTPASDLIQDLGGDEVAKLALEVLGTVREPVDTLIRETKVDLPIVGNWVRVPVPDLNDPLNVDPIGGMPVAQQLQQLSGLATGVLSTTLSTNLPPSSLMESDPGKGATAGVPALLGRLKGTLSETVQELREVTKVLDSVSVKASVRITVTDDINPSSTAITNRIEVLVPTFAGWKTVSSLPAAGEPLGAKPFSFSLRLAPLFSELKGPIPDVAKVSVHVSVDLEVQPPAVGGSTPPPVKATINLPAVPLVLPTIPVPTIVVLCEGPNFFGRKLVIVPSDSLLGKAVTAGGKPIGEALSLTNSVIKSLKTVLSAAGAAVAFSGFLDGGAAGAPGVTNSGLAASMPVQTAAAVLSTLADAPGQTIIVASSQLSNLDNYVFEPGGFFGGRFTGSDMASSMIIVGRPGTTVSFGQHAGWPSKQELTPFTVKLDANQLACAISELGPNVPFGTGYAYDPTDPASFTTKVFGGSITSFSPKQNNGEIYSAAITRPGPPLLTAN